MISLDLNTQPKFDSFGKYFQTPQLKQPNLDTSWMSYLNGNKSLGTPSVSPYQQLAGQLVGNVGGRLSTFASQMFGDEESGQIAGGLVGSAVGSTFSGLSDNLVKGAALGTGLGQDVGSSVAGTALGIGGTYAGKGITNAMGNTWGGRFLGQGVASTIGGIGGGLAGNAIKGKGLFDNIRNISTAVKAGKAVKAGEKIKDLQQIQKLGKVGSMNIAGMAGQVVGTALSAATGPSHAYQGKYGKITQGLDHSYDAIQSAIGFVPGWGQLVSGIMALNKGLTNIFGSTDGMTKQDAILGSAWAGPLNWINMAGAKRTGIFNNQSWQNTEKTDSFMQNSFGNLGEKFAKAREEAGKTYGTFSRKAYRKAQANVGLANRAWGQVLNMANQNEYQNIRANDMTSINNQRYQQMIQGGFQPLARGKNGMKILSFATTSGYQDTGMRLLSRAALNSSGMRILSNAAI